MRSCSLSLWAVGAVLSVVLAFGTIGAIFWDEGPCNDELDTSPQIEFDITYEQSSGNLSVVHERGDKLTGENTNSLTVRIRPEESEKYTTRYVLASDSNGGFPVESGDVWVFKNASVDGRPLSDDDVLRIVWTGPDDLPSYCPNRDGESGTLGKRVIGEDKS